MNADMESRPAGEECVCTLAPLGESVYVCTADEIDMIGDGLEPVDYSPNGKPVFALEEVIAWRLRN